MKAYSTAAEPWWAAAAGCPPAKIAGSRKCSIRFAPPSTAGTPTKPATTEPAASTSSGTVIEGTDSWSFRSIAAPPRKSPKKVISTCRVM